MTCNVVEKKREKGNNEIELGEKYVDHFCYDKDSLYL